MSEIRTILHPTDFSPTSRRAFQLAESLAKSHGAKLIVLHVMETPMIIPSGVMMAPPPEPAVNHREELWNELRQVAPSDASIAHEHRLAEGDPATAVLQVAVETGSDLIVLGTHGRTGLKRLLMGSVAEKISRHATCPVMTVNEPA